MQNTRTTQAGFSTAKSLVVILSRRIATRYRLALSHTPIDRRIKGPNGEVGSVRPLIGEDLEREIRMNVYPFFRR
jgi:hypothetical protein